jgi:hypothetical protein
MGLPPLPPLPLPHAPRIGVVAFLVAAAAVAVLSGCGSSKPDYCADRTNLQNSVKALTQLNLSSGVSSLKSHVTQIQQDATTLVNSAKNDFPSQTSAITSSVNALKNSITGLGSNPSAAQVATITKDGRSVVTSVNSFMDASNSACS